MENPSFFFFFKVTPWPLDLRPPNVGTKIAFNPGSRHLKKMGWGLGPSFLDEEPLRHKQKWDETPEPFTINKNGVKTLKNFQGEIFP